MIWQPSFQGFYPGFKSLIAALLMPLFAGSLAPTVPLIFKSYTKRLQLKKATTISTGTESSRTATNSSKLVEILL